MPRGHRMTPSYASSLFVTIASATFFFFGENLDRNRGQSYVHITELVMELTNAQGIMQKDTAKARDTAAFGRLRQVSLDT